MVDCRRAVKRVFKIYVLYVFAQTSAESITTSGKTLSASEYVLAPKEELRGHRIPGTNYAIKNYKVEFGRNVLMDHILPLNGYKSTRLENHGNWCKSFYGGAHTEASHGNALDDIDKICKHWRQQTRCLLESDLCVTGQDYYTLNTYDDNSIGCESSAYEQCGYEKCTIDVEALSKIVLLLNREKYAATVTATIHSHVGYGYRAAETNISLADSMNVLFKSSSLVDTLDDYSWMDDLYVEVLDRLPKSTKKGCCHVGLGDFKIYDDGTQICQPDFLSKEGREELCEKVTIEPVNARQSSTFQENHENYGAQLAIDDKINDFNRTGYIQSTLYNREKKWLLIDYQSEYQFDEIVMHTRTDPCPRCYTKLSIQLFSTLGKEVGWCRFSETGKYYTPNRYLARPGEIIKFSCSSKTAQYMKISRLSGSLSMEEIKAFSYKCQRRN